MSVLKYSFINRMNMHMLPGDRMYTTDVRQHHCLVTPGRGQNKCQSWKWE